MTRVWNWAPECLYMPPTGLFAQTAGKREKQECVCAQHKMSFVKSFNMKNSSRKGATDRRKGKRENVENLSMDRTSERRSTYCDWIDAVTQEGKRGVGKRTWINGNSTSQHEKDLLFLCFYLLFVSCRKISSCEPYPCQKRHPRLIIIQQRIIRQSLFPSIFLQRCWRSIEPISLVVPLGRLGIRSAPLVKVITSLALQHLPWLYSRRL